MIASWHNIGAVLSPLCIQFFKAFVSCLSLLILALLAFQFFRGWLLRRKSVNLFVHLAVPLLCCLHDCYAVFIERGLIHHWGLLAFFTCFNECLGRPASKLAEF